ncbi:hypothetical protein CIPAW_09G156000 [Carya illinoinensis]|uniref:Receptor-like serine/threonine-protein kinase n=1 Tax=Carya illinoinensis TaxID=32201 RepID=A0A8T1PN59_CARIL|nr:hypothetical protein CIPAW_09G156000 [Carya illinoinensis]
MRVVRETKLFDLLILLSYFCLEFGTAIDTITTTKFINDPETLISNGGDFKLGFFSPTNSTYRYVGIWYAKVSASSVIWVANRNNPLKSLSGALTISEDGNLVVLDEQEKIIWSSNITGSVFNSSAQLLDSGNLVLQENNTGTIIWESFQHPADTLVPKMKLSTNVRTSKKVQLTSWTNQFDPSIGTFSVGIDVFNLPELSIWNGSSRYWRSGPWNSRVFIGIPSMNSVFLDGFSLIDDQEGTFYFSFAFSNESILSNFVLNAQGNIVQNYSNKGDNWEVGWVALETECDVYGMCGAFGICNSKSSPICNCLVGFEPKNIEEWNRGNWGSGCVRRTPLQCERLTTGGEEGKKDAFLELKMMKVPDLVDWSSAFEDKCRDQCLENCSCIAYAYDAGTGCMSWTRDLIDLQEFSIGGVDLYVRVANSELDRKEVDVKVVITITTIVGTLFLAICTFSLWRCMAKRKARKRKTREILSLNIEQAYAKFPGQSKLEDSMNQVRLQELPIFSFEELASATNSFHQTNKLGQGGFGPVYKGKLLHGQEIAVKRLSRSSGQGLEEFMNEVVVISKLQHRNLVRLLGGCVEGEEKMLIYEYMPNKSLDIFLFDPSKQELLDWTQRFQIIEDLNPKISDFGMARIFGGNEDQANTNRVVGTYGYMSPEYAMGGRFSEKSDIFSFGVLLLEIVSGRRNTSFYHDEQAMSLLEFVWKMWNANKIAALVDPMISEPCFEMEVLRCIHVGLLCVQDFAKDRPTVSIAISMLKSEIVDLPRPKQPAFTATQIATDTASQCNKSGCSINNVTVTMVQGR